MILEVLAARATTPIPRRGAASAPRHARRSFELRSGITIPRCQSRFWALECTYRRTVRSVIGLDNTTEGDRMDILNGIKVIDLTMWAFVPSAGGVLRIGGRT